MAIEPVQLGPTTWKRLRADEARMPCENRFAELNPVNLKDQKAWIERPALVELIDVTDPEATPEDNMTGRRLFTQAGFSNGDLFHVYGNQLWKHHMETDRTITSTQITGLVDTDGSPDMAATYTKLFITDGSALQWTDGTSALASIATPDGIPMISLDVFNGYVLCVQNNSDRFYWIQPGAIVIDPLDFATAERTPDHILQVRAVGDEFWLLGETTIEVWRATGDGDAPFARIEGRRWDFGIYGGTAVRTKDSVIVVANDGTVQDISGTPREISNNSVAERMRNAIFADQEEGLL